MLGCSWVAAQLVASQEGLSSMSEWVNNSDSHSLNADCLSIQYKVWISGQFAYLRQRINTCSCIGIQETSRGTFVKFCWIARHYVTEDTVVHSHFCDSHKFNKISKVLYALKQWVKEGACIFHNCWKSKISMEIHQANRNIILCTIISVPLRYKPEGLGFESRWGDFF
jgi:hypothetical protein